MWMLECAACSDAKDEGLHAWMKHLTEMHTLPTEWPSERVAALSGSTILRPYTTVTESKKKRRKDSVPRPLNSFMLFAQHIRRNVLRVFSDASNSVISQQLGDLWRTVPQDYRNKYDEESNKLVKIHQLEFPNYKYQPKKRQTMTNSTAGSSFCGDSSRATVNRFRSEAESKFDFTLEDTNSEDFKLSRDKINYDYSTLHRPQLVDSQNESAHCTISGSNDQTKTAERQHLANSWSGKTPSSSPSNSCVFESNTLSVGVPSNGPGHYHSLSSVLPPLLTPSLRSLKSESVDIFTNQHSCDSAYASGINSSSSSSASSPSVADLLSPTKSNGIIFNLLKSSPVRRKIQFVPIRPQSPQAQTNTGCQIVRQRFLSANNGICYSGLRTGSTEESSHQNNCSLDKAERTESHVVPKIHSLTAPIYLRIAVDNGTNPAEDVLLALPPGTKLVQATEGMAHAQPRCQLLQLTKNPVSSTKPNEAPVNGLFNVIRPVNVLTVASDQQGPPQSVMNIIQANIQHPSCSPTSNWSPKSCNAESPSQCLNGEAVQHIIFNQKTSDVSPISESRDSSIYDSFTYHSSHDYEMTQDQFDTEFENTLSVTRCDKETSCTQFDVATESKLSVEEWDRIANREDCSKSFCLNDRMLSNTSTTSLAPLAIDTWESEPELMQTDDCLEPELSNTEFSDDNFDSSFDALIHSIDITTFLPGAYSVNEESTIISSNSTADRLYSKPANLSAPCEPTAKSDFIITDKRSRGNDLCTNCSSGSDSSNIEVNDEKPSQPVIIQANRPDSTFTADSPNTGLDCLTPEDGSLGFDLVDMQHLIYTNVPHSQLSDLDLLDKSSLLPFKQDWCLQAYE